MSVNYETVRLDVSGTLSDPAGAGVAITFFHAGGATSAVLQEGAVLDVGRAAPCAVVLPDDSLSRQHARVRLVHGQVLVEDLGSTNGTRVGERRISEETPATPADLIVFGNVAARITDQHGALGLTSRVESYDLFRQHVTDEIVRARHFQRSAAVLAVRALDVSAHALLFASRLAQHLRPIDRMALYSRSLALVLVSEADQAFAERVARVFTDTRDEPRLLVGAAMFPMHGSTSDALIDEARAAVFRASSAAPVQLVDVTERALLPSAARARVVMSPPMVDLFRTLERLHRSSIPVLIQGETGVGKEIVARAVHEGGPRAAGPLVCVNCGALAGTLIESTLFGHEKGAFTGAERLHKGVFESAAGGTVFLDEIGELDLSLQPKLLRVLESKRVTRLGSSKEIDVDVRIVAATHRDLDEMVAQGKFREDLLFRLNAVTLRVPPLRERREEIVPLAELFLAGAAEQMGAPPPLLSPEVHELLLAFPWPGNLRELKNAMERAAVICTGDRIGPAELPDSLRRFAAPFAPAMAATPARTLEDQTAPVDAPLGADLRSRVRDFEVRVIEEALRAAGYNQTLAAQRLGTPLRTLVHKIKTLGVRKGPA